MRAVPKRHGNVDILEDLARSDSDHAIAGLDEVVAFAAPVLAAEMIDEAEIGTELLGFHQESRAVCRPLI